MPHTNNMNININMNNLPGSYSRVGNPHAAASGSYIHNNNKTNAPASNATGTPDHRHMPPSDYMPHGHGHLGPHRHSIPRHAHVNVNGPGNGYDQPPTGPSLSQPHQFPDRRHFHHQRMAQGPPSQHMQHHSQGHGHAGYDSYRPNAVPGSSRYRSASDDIRGHSAPTPGYGHGHPHSMGLNASPSTENATHCFVKYDVLPPAPIRRAPFYTYNRGHGTVSVTNHGEVTNINESSNNACNGTHPNPSSNGYNMISNSNAKCPQDYARDLGPSSTGTQLGPNQGQDQRQVFKEDKLINSMPHQPRSRQNSRDQQHHQLSPARSVGSASNPMIVSASIGPYSGIVKRAPSDVSCDESHSAISSNSSSSRVDETDIMNANGNGNSPSYTKDEVFNIGCTCKKSKCLKLYCQCFASKSMCEDRCRCQECKNNPHNSQDRNDAIQTVLMRNPSAFETKFKAARKGAGAVAHKNGCKCRRSACLKKYCECFHAQVKCSTNCRCVGCKNMPGGSEGDDEAGADIGGSTLPSHTKHVTVVDMTDGKHDEVLKTYSNANVMDAAQNLAFLKNMSPARPEQPRRSNQTKDHAQEMYRVPTLTTSDGADRDDDGSEYEREKYRGLSNGSERASVKSVLSSNDAVLMAAYAMTELCGTPSRVVASGAISNPSLCSPTIGNGYTYKQKPGMATTPQAASPPMPMLSKRKIVGSDGTISSGLKRGRYGSIDNFKTPKNSSFSDSDGGGRPSNLVSKTAITPTLAYEADSADKESRMNGPASVPKLKRSSGVHETLSAQIETEAEKNKRAVA